MVSPSQLPVYGSAIATGYRLVNSKFPPIALFDDVASPGEFEALYELQAMTNPRLQNEAGRLELIPRSEIPFGISGCSYAAAPFTHINPDGSRFSDGRYGVLYMADTLPTALAEVRHHQQSYWSRVEGIEFERIVLRGLRCAFDQAGMLNATALPDDDPIYDPVNLQAAQVFGSQLKHSSIPGLHYRSVRRPGHYCWGLMTPKPMVSMIQAAHYEMIWNGTAISSVNRLKAL